MQPARAPLLHIGFHKTGSSWLQQVVFDDATQGFCRPWSSHEIAHSLVLPNDLDFDPAEARARLHEVATGCSEHGRAINEASHENLVPVLSWERLSGSPHAGGFDSAALAGRLKAVFPGGRVLIAVREQRSAIYALYQQYVRDGGIATLDGYLRPRNPAEIPQFSFDHLAYDRLVRRYRELFGAERVLVVLYEDLVADPVTFARRVARFAGAEPDARTSVSGSAVNRSYGALTVALKRYANRWFVRTSLSPAARLYVRNHAERFARLDRWLPHAISHPLERRWRERIDELVGSRYGNSNRRLGEVLGRNLADLGYDVTDDTAHTSGPGTASE